MPVMNSRDSTCANWRKLYSLTMWMEKGVCDIPNLKAFSLLRLRLLSTQRVPMMRKTRNTSTPITAPAIVFTVLLRFSDDRVLDSVGCNLALVAELELDSEAISVFVLIDI